MWKSHLRDNYTSFDEFAAYSNMYGLHARLGFNSAMSAWEANPIIQGSTDPSDYKTFEKKVNVKSMKKSNGTSFLRKSGIKVRSEIAEDRTGTLALYEKGYNLGLKDKKTGGKKKHIFYTKQEKKGYSDAFKG